MANKLKGGKEGMSTNSHYSKAEDDFIKDQLVADNNRVGKETFQMWSDLWPGFFKIVREPFALFTHLQRIVKKDGLAIIVESQPPRKRNRSNNRCQRPKKTRLSDQVNFIIQQEINYAIKRATNKIVRLVDSLSEENKDLKEEVRNLRPYQGIVEKNYQKEVQ